MRLLLDTHILIWVLSGSDRLNRQARAAIIEPENDVFFSAVNTWEIAIKASLGRADFRVDPELVMAEAAEIGLQELTLTAEVAAKVAALPLYHRDPFDRLLIAQAISERAQFYTADPILKNYGDIVSLVT